MTGLIASSLLFLVGAAITLGVGWVNASGTFVWVSILASAATAITLALAYTRSKAAAAAALRRPARAGRSGATTRPDTRTRARSGPNDADVVGVASSRKFHRSDCRYARVRGAAKMTRSLARRRGMEPCGICKP